MLKDSLVATRQAGDSRFNVEGGQIDVRISSHIDTSPQETGYVCLVTDQGRLEMADERFRSNLESIGLMVEEGCLLPESVDLRMAWLTALRQVRESGQAQFFALTQHPRLESVGIVPQPDSAFVAVRLPRARMCSPECVRGYARLIALTPRETSVLDLLVQGHTPATVANELSTRESTVRTQIKSILAKSSHNSMRGLLVTLACLPSMSAVAVNQSAHRNGLSASV